MSRLPYPPAARRNASKQGYRTGDWVQRHYGNPIDGEEVSIGRVVEVHGHANGVSRNYRVRWLAGPLFHTYGEWACWGYLGTGLRPAAISDDEKALLVLASQETMD